jgi:hypothetical protein
MRAREASSDTATRSSTNCGSSQIRESQRHPLGLTRDVRVPRQ